MSQLDIPPKEVWGVGAAYEPYVGRWSRLVAREFLRWLEVPPQRHWLDVGCGTGAVSQTILQVADPATLTGVDRAPGFVAYARQQVQDDRAQFREGDAQALPVEDSTFDAVVSGLMLNFVPEPERAVAEMARATRPDGVTALYVWDYAEGMQFMRYFWEAAVALDPAASKHNEGRRFVLCRPDVLSAIFQQAGLRNVETRAVDIATTFRDFDDFWTPFLGGQGPAPSYVKALADAEQVALREHLRATLPSATDGTIPLTARAWAVRGVR